MPRPKEFDPDEALEQAMRLFWEKGYEATSVQDLVEHLGIGRASLYETFGNKQELFLAAMIKHRAMVWSQFLGMVENSPKPLDAIRKLFGIIAEKINSGLGKHGCLVANTASEMDALDDETAKLVRTMVNEREEAFYKALRRAQSQGQLDKTKNPRKLARYLNTVMLGLGVLARTSPNARVVNDTVESALMIFE